MNTDTTYPKTDISCAILAGGKGSRMNNRDKGLVELAGRPMIEHVIERVAPQVGGIVINANRHREEYRRYKFPIIADAAGGFLGPLAGMAAALRHCDTRWTMTVPCDSPLLPLDLASRLYRTLETHDADIAVAHDGERLHPVFCLLSRHLADNLDDFLERGERKIDRWFERVNTVHADFSDKPDCFGNVNTADELMRVEQILSRQ